MHRDDRRVRFDTRVSKLILNAIEENGRTDLSSLTTPFVLDMLRKYRDHRLHTMALQYQRTYEAHFLTEKYPTMKEIIDCLYFDSMIPFEVSEAVAGRRYLEEHVWLPNNPKCFVDTIGCIDHPKC